MPTQHEALPGRPTRAFAVPATHAVLGSPLQGPWSPGAQIIHVALGCFWGSEEIYWQIPGVVSTAVGYQGGFTPNPTYEEACTGRTGHTETVQVVYDPQQVSTRRLLAAFWENHDPTQGFRQGNDLGTQYRSAIFWTTDEQREQAEATRELCQKALRDKGYGDITTELRSAADAGEFYYAEDYHQQYLAKNPHGYRCHSATGITIEVD